jgi:hypothetical protein
MNNVNLRRLLCINVDLDDCIYDTEPEMCRILLAEYGYNAPRDCYLTPENTDGLLKHLLDNPTFMASTPLRKEFENCSGYFNRLRVHWAKVARLQFVTHRGYHPDGKTQTMRALLRDRLQHIPVVYLDPKVHSDKMAWLQKHQPQYDHILFDDKPCHNFEAGTTVGADSVYVMDQPWNRDARYGGYPNRITCASGLMTVVDRAIHNHVATYFGKPKK